MSPWPADELLCLIRPAMFSSTSILFPISLLTTLIVSSAIVLAQDEPAAAVAASESDAAVRTLVDSVASANFSDRQKATAELLKLDAAAVPVLESELTVATGETASRLRQIVAQLRKRLFDDHLQVFSADLTEAKVAGLPQWDRFSALAGTGTSAMTVFSEVLNSERELFATRLFAPRELPAVLESRSAEFARLCHGRSEDEFPIASCIALMLLGSESETRLIRATSTNISDALDDPRFSKLITDGVHAAIVREVTSEWLKRSGIAADRPLLFSIQHELPVGRSIAHRIIESQSRRQDMYYSLLCLARLNDPEDLPLVESLLETPTTLWPPRSQLVQRLLPDRDVDSSFSVQTRDVALAVAIHLRGAAPEDFGIPVRASAVTFFVVDSLGFDNDETRAVALAKYRAQFGSSGEKSE